MTISICLLLIPLIPTTNYIPNKTEKVEEGDLQSLNKAVVYGFLPQIDDNNITYFGIPQFKWIIIPKDKFEGHIGIFFIFGYWDPSPLI